MKLIICCLCLLFIGCGAVTDKGIEKAKEDDGHGIQHDVDGLPRRQRSRNIFEPIHALTFAEPTHHSGGQQNDG